MNTDDTSGSSNSVDVRSESLEPPSWEGSLQRYVLSLLNRLSLSSREVSILLTDDQTIADLNARYRNRDEATDVLSFVAEDAEGDPFGDICQLMGDVVVDVPLVERQAAAFGVSFEEELRRVVTHGVLHLAGHQHRSNDFQEEPMLRLQEELLHQMKERIL